MSEPIDTLEVVLTCDIDKFLKKMKSGSQALDDVSNQFETTTENLEEFSQTADETADTLAETIKKTQKTSESIQELGRHADRSADHIDDLTYQLRKQQRSADDSGRSNRTAGRWIEDLGDNAEDAAGELDNLVTSLKSEKSAAVGAEHANRNISHSIRDVGDRSAQSADGIAGLKAKLEGITIGGVGIVAGITAIATAIAKLSAESYNAVTQIKDLNVDLAAGIGGNIADIKRYSDVVEDLADKGITRDISVPVVAQIATLYPDWDDRTVENMAEHYIWIADKMGVSADSIIKDMERVFGANKWDITDAQQQLHIVETIAGATQASNVEFGEFVSLLNQGDRAFQLLGKSAEDAIYLIAAHGDSLEDVQAYIDSVERVANMKALELGSEEAVSVWLQNLVDATKGITDQTELINALNEYGVKGLKLQAAWSDMLSSKMDVQEEYILVIKANAEALSEMNKEMEKTAQRDARLQETLKDITGFTIMGDAIDDALNQLDEFLLKNKEVLSILSDIATATVFTFAGQSQFYKDVYLKKRLESGTAPSSYYGNGNTNITINQTLTAPKDPYEERGFIEDMAEGIRNIFT